MQTSATGRAFIEAFEGKFLKTYDDGTGVLTIGYGHTTAAGPPVVARGMTISDAECDGILAADLRKVEVEVGKLIKVPLTQPQFDALVSFHFNTGALGSGSVDDKINAGTPAAAMMTLLQYDHAGGRVMAGLTRRRKAERLMFLGDVAGAITMAGAHVDAGSIMPQAPQPRPSTASSPPSPAPSPAPPQTFIQKLNSALALVFPRK